MVGRWGMSERIGPVSVFPAEGDPRMLGVSEGTLDAVAEEVRQLVDECYRQAIERLRENRPRLDAIVAQLLEHETLDEAAVYVAAGIARERGDVASARGGPPAPPVALAPPVAPPLVPVLAPCDVMPPHGVGRDGVAPPEAGEATPPAPFNGPPSALPSPCGRRLGTG
jgi:Peptidase family M41